MASNYAANLRDLEHFEEARSLLRKTMPIARRVFGDKDIVLFRMIKIYAAALYEDTGATLNDLHEAVTTLEELEPTARRVLGGAHPLLGSIKRQLQAARTVLDAREVGENVVFVGRPRSS